MHPEIWIDIAGYGGRYQINPYGRIRRVYASCIHYLTPRIKSKGNVIVRLTDAAGRRREHQVSRLVAAAFKPAPAPGMVLCHVNQCKSDTYVGNLKWVSKRSLGKITGPKSRRRPVVKISTDGCVLDYYSSARAAGRANYMSCQTVLDYCNGRIKKKKAAPDGCVYRWDSE